MSGRDDATLIEAARRGDSGAFGKLVEPYRRELQAHCYRMSGSVHDAEDLLQESLLRAWRGLPGFEGRAGLRTWLYKIATNACLNALETKKARALPIDLRPAGSPTDPAVPQLEPVWLEPCPASFYEGSTSTPAARYDRRESITLAFMAALQLLPARQRALLVLHDVLGWSADECAELLETTLAGVNSALQRARATLTARRASWQAAPPANEAVRPLLERYVRAWETADLPGLVSLLHEEATLSMPPIPLWLRGATALATSMDAMVFAGASSDTFRIVETAANGAPALAVYRREAGGHRPYALQLLECHDGRITAITAFLDTSLFAPFGLPAALRDGC